MAEISKEVSLENKINMLERIIKAVFGCDTDQKIEYRADKDLLLPWIELECDVNNATKVLSYLENAEIDYSFSNWERELPKEEQEFHNQPFEGYITITMYIQPEYWRKCRDLEKEIKELKEKATLVVPKLTEEKKVE